MNRQEIIQTLTSTQPKLSIGTLTTDDQAGAIEILEAAEIKFLHVDVMDGKIWPKETVGPDFVASLETKLIKDIHLLIDQPDEHIPAFAAAGAGAISFSVEYTPDIGKSLSLIEEAGEHILRGVSLNPSTSLEAIKPYLEQIDLVILLAIGPETGKETFFDTLPAKIEQLRAWKPGILITLDGAVKKNNVGEVAAMGPDFIATGSAVFDGNDAAANIREMEASIAASS
ncbi:MAG: hypothetical protein Q7Q71_11730 [Verrucomicrobiota bacterium JB023]|nr:hypothetical protein [Verrucomicrobiota bacterium JB023]